MLPKFLALVLCLLALSGCAGSTQAAFRLAPPHAQSCLDQLPQQGWSVVQDAPPTKLLSQQVGTRIVYVLIYASPLGPLVAFADAGLAVGAEIPDNAAQRCVSP